MSDTELAYLAGFFDGEGCISIVKHKKAGRIYFALDASISQRDWTILGELKSVFGGHIQRTHGKSGDFYVWKLTARRAYCFLKQIDPYLRYKSSQCAVAIEFQERVVGNKSFGATEREKYWQALKTLKQVYYMPI